MLKYCESFKVEFSLNLFIIKKQLMMLKQVQKIIFIGDTHIEGVVKSILID